MYVVGVAVALVALTLADGRAVFVNPAEIVSVRERHHDEKILPRNIKCVLNTADGKFIGVIEDCDSVRQKLESDR